MIPVYQTRHGPEGNCFEACLASILEIGIEQVPVFSGWDDLRKWLTARNWLLEFGRSDGHAIASVQTLRGIHAVVCLDGQIVHDPSPRPFARQGQRVVLWTKVRELRDVEGHRC